MVGSAFSESASVALVRYTVLSVVERDGTSKVPARPGACLASVHTLPTSVLFSETKTSWIGSDLRSGKIESNFACANRVASK